jgi:hypothetical protein
LMRPAIMDHWHFYLVQGGLFIGVGIAVALVLGALIWLMSQFDWDLPKSAGRFLGTLVIASVVGGTMYLSEKIQPVQNWVRDPIVRQYAQQPYRPLVTHVPMIKESEKAMKWRSDLSPDQQKALFGSEFVRITLAGPRIFSISEFSIEGRTSKDKVYRADPAFSVPFYLDSKQVVFRLYGDKRSGQWRVYYQTGKLDGPWGYSHVEFTELLDGRLSLLIRTDEILTQVKKFSHTSDSGTDYHKTSNPVPMPDFRVILKGKALTPSKTSVEFEFGAPPAKSGTQLHTPAAKPLNSAA